MMKKSSSFENPEPYLLTLYLKNSILAVSTFNICQDVLKSDNLLYINGVLVILNRTALLVVKGIAAFSNTLFWNATYSNIQTMWMHVGYLKVLWGTDSCRHPASFLTNHNRIIKQWQTRHWTVTSLRSWTGFASAKGFVRSITTQNDAITAK